MTPTYQPTSQRVKRVRDSIRLLLTQRLPETLYYHNPAHTLDSVLGVVSIADTLAQMEGVCASDREILQTAAYFHDTGFIEQYKANEPIGARFARDLLPIYDYSPGEIQRVERLILATQYPTSPKDHLEEIICDADVDNFGRDDFFEKNDAVRRELGVTDMRQWYENSLRLLEGHRFYTTAARTLRDAKKQENLAQLRQKLGELTGEHPAPSLPSSVPALLAAVALACHIWKGP